MRHITKSMVTLAVLTAFVTGIWGCEEPNLTDTNRARLMAGENFELQKQLKLRNSQIREQKDLLSRCEDEKAKLQQQLGDVSAQRTRQIAQPVSKEQMESADTAIDALRIVAETNKEIERLTAENRKLKAGLQQLQSQPARPVETAVEPDSQ